MKIRQNISVKDRFLNLFKSDESKEEGRKLARQEERIERLCKWYAEKDFVPLGMRGNSLNLSLFEQGRGRTQCLPQFYEIANGSISYVIHSSGRKGYVVWQYDINSLRELIADNIQDVRQADTIAYRSAVSLANEVSQRTGTPVENNVIGDIEKFRKEMEEFGLAEKFDSLLGNHCDRCEDYQTNPKANYCGECGDDFGSERR